MVPIAPSHTTTPSCRRSRKPFTAAGLTSGAPIIGSLADAAGPTKHGRTRNCVMELRARGRMVIPATSSLAYLRDKLAAGDPPWLDVDAWRYVEELAGV